MSTHADFLCELADNILLSRPHDAARLLEIAHDVRFMTEALDDMAAAEFDASKVEGRVAAELARICKGHHGR
jgi:hypothetical protein